MAQLIVRNIEKEVKARLQRRARLHGRSMEEEVREILRDAAKNERRKRRGLGAEIASLFARTGLKPGEEIRELHEIEIRHADLEE